MTSPALALRRAIESFHAACYFAPEVRQPYVDAGLHPWASYFGQRAAPMGAVDAPTVSAAFFNFNPRLVERSVPSVWDTIEPDRAVELRFEGVGHALRRLIDDLPEPERLHSTAEIAWRGVEACEFAGRPLAAAHAGIEAPDDPLLSLWWAVTILREHRGDGHIAALVGNGLGPVEALVTSPGFTEMPPEHYKRNRRWDDETWNRGVERARSRGWITDAGDLTDEGRTMRDRVEEVTDATMRRAVDAIGADLDRLVDAVGSLSREVRRAGGFG